MNSHSQRERGSKPRVSAVPPRRQIRDPGFAIREMRLQAACQLSLKSASSENRTRTPFQAPGFKSGASTNSAILARRKRRGSNSQDALSNARRYSKPVQFSISATLPRTVAGRFELPRPDRPVYSGSSRAGLPGCPQPPTEGTGIEPV